MEIFAGIISAVAVLFLILGGYIGRPGGLSKAAKMLAGGVLVASLIVLLALVLDRAS
jgi:hypothetical protein